MTCYELETAFGHVRVTLVAARADSVAPLVYQGAPRAIASVQRLIETRGGYFGHIVGTAATPRDLAVAMAHASLAPYRPRLVDGAEILQQPPTPRDEDVT